MLLKSLLTRTLLIKFCKYIVVGGSAALINWIVFYMATYVGLWYIYAGLASFMLATLWNFLLARIFIFTNSSHHILKESALVYIASSLGLLIDIGTLYICVEFLALHAMLGKVIATGMAFVFNFSIRFWYIYKE